MLAKGDKLIVKKDVASFLKEGDVVEVVEIHENGNISFAFGEDYMHMGLMNTSEYEEHFEKYEEPEMIPSVSPERIKEIMDNSEIIVETIFEKCTIVTCKLPNGFVIVESSACVSPENYDEDLGAEICLKRIEDKVWELEGYLLQTMLHEGYCCCEGCCEEGWEDECLDTDLDCDDCTEYDCIYRV